MVKMVSLHAQTIDEISEFDELIHWAEYYRRNVFYKDAIETLNQALDIAEKEQESEVFNELASIGDELTELARGHREKDRHNYAIVVLKQALEAAQEKEKKTGSFYELAVTYDEWGKYEQAIEFYKKFLEIRNNSEDALYNIATIYTQEIEEYEKGAEYYEKYLKIRPDDPDAFFYLGVCHEKSGQFEDALQDYQKAVDLESGSDLIVRDALAILNINPHDTKILYILGTAYQELKDAESAIQCYKKILEFDSEHVDASVSLGNIYAESEEYEKAIKYLDKALRIKSDNDPTISTLIDSLNRLIQKKQEVETEKRLFSDLKHTLGNILSTGPTLAEKVLSFLREVTGEKYQDKKIRFNINYAVNLVSKFRVTNNLLDTFRFYAKGSKYLQEEWAKDKGGEFSSTYLFALIFKHELTHTIFSNSFIGQCKRLINSDTKDSLIKLREAFLNDVLSLEINSENAYKVLDWIHIHLPILNISVKDNLSLDERGVRFNFLFICFSELIYNALKYTDCRGPVHVTWKEENSHFVFLCRNTFDKYIPRSKKGLYFITQLSNTLGGDFSYKTERSDFIAEFKIPKKLFSEGEQNETFMDRRF